MLELDWLLGRFLDLGYSALDETQRVAFDRLLAEDDQRLSDWFLVRAEVSDSGLRWLVSHIREVVGESTPNATVARPNHSSPARNDLGGFP